MAVRRRLLAFLLTLIPFAAYGASPAEQVKIDTGTIEGKAHGTVRAFLGIPYASPPVGDLRWKPPVPPARWTGVRASHRIWVAMHASQGLFRHDFPRSGHQ